MAPMFMEPLPMGLYPTSVHMEAAKFLQMLIHEPTEDPTKLAACGANVTDEYYDSSKLQQGATLLKQEDRLLRWLLVNHCDVKLGIYYFDDADVDDELRSFRKNIMEESRE